MHRELDKFDPHAAIDVARTPPSSWYVSDEFWRHDKAAIFAASWQPVARRDQLAIPGSYLAGCIADEPFVVTRDGRGALHAFSNVCRHKAMIIASRAGLAERLVCPYHAWTYGLDGRLETAPRVAGIGHFDRDAMSLPAFGVCEWGPWIFVNPSPDAEPVAAQVPEVDALLDASQWQRSSFYGTRSWTIECNWKVYVDNYLDGGYHIPHMHPSLDAQLDMASYTTELFDRSSVQTSGARAGRDDRTEVDVQARIGSGAIYAWLFPNVMINRYGPCMDMNWVVPRGPARCEVVYEFYFDRDAELVDEGFMQASVAQADITQREDIAISESVHRGLCARAYDQGRYAPRVEMAEHHFHRLLHAAYSRHQA